ncbi:MAG: vanadium-dependent haloperoxidase [Sphingobacteriales bacterium]|nr:vanadium-dependent haloperoxidase [Sphingobacteriales bacterium]MBI3720113.1 vanadium-dependent haloperoxidase [Sphingobacteriales bacterium]
MKLKSILSLAILILLFSGCRKNDFPGGDKKNPADVANAWMQMQIRLTRSTAGYNSVVSNRSFGYAGITMYEALVPGIPGYRSLLPQIGGAAVAADKNRDQYYWPASVNAAMAMLTKSFFETTSPANKASIDSLEAAYTAKFQTEADVAKIQNAVDYGHKVAASIFAWSATDGGHQAYSHIVDPTYIAPVGEGLWVPTFPAFGPPVHPHWGDNRSFIANIAASTQPAAPIAYSANPKSPFYAMVNELYTISLSLTHEDSTVAKFWGDQPGNLNVPAHATNILTQLIVKNNFDLGAAAVAYALHGIAMNDAAISVFKTKYQYNQLRPITYIRNVMGYSTWNSVIPTPPHPEYTAAHAVVSAASATVLEKIFGNYYSFTDHTYDATYGARSFNSFDDYAKEAGRARVLAGIHYSPSVAAGLTQGRKVGYKVVQLNLHSFNK